MVGRKWKNLFYTLLIPVGLVFVVTVFAYSYLAFVAVNAAVEDANSHARHPLFVWLKEHGARAVFIELAILAVLTGAAMATDTWWTRRSEHAEDSPVRRMNR